MDLIEVNSLIFMFDFVHGKLPPSFNNTWHRNNEMNERYILRNGLDFNLPNLSYLHLDRHPLMRFPKLWNNISQELKDINVRSNFSKTLKKKYLENLT